MLENLEPVNVFHYFEEISKIPRGSGNTKQISDYCVQFAEEHHLWYRQDEYHNVIIIKEASKGYENDPPLILQGHLDMVCEKNADTEHDFEKEGLKLAVKDDDIYAEGTTLGGDDGIAIAYALALLSDEKLQSPRLEAVFTVDEETGMEGAFGIDLSPCKGRHLINIDSEEEGIFLTSCAGGIRNRIILPVTYEPLTGNRFEIHMGGLLGGHSGTDIHLGRANSCKIAGQYLYYLKQKGIRFSIASLLGGQKDNAIPREADMMLCVHPKDAALIEQISEQFLLELKNLYASETNLFMTFQKSMDSEDIPVISQVQKEKLIYLLYNCPNGIQQMSPQIEGFVETSLNLGVIRLTQEEFSMEFALRSSNSAAKKELLERLSYFAEFIGCENETAGDYPAWEYRQDSVLRRRFIEAYKRLYKKEPKIQGIHAGLECGILSSKINDLDCVSMGPDIFDIHTPAERMSISSVQRTYELLKQVISSK